MTRASKIDHRFVEFIPDQLEDGVLYVTIPYATAVHLCLCGCRSRVVTPLAPTDWQLTFDGETVSLYPSIGNWSFDCQSHYWIRNDRVSWSGRWSPERIEAGRARDQRLKTRAFGEDAAADPAGSSATTQASGAGSSGVLRRLMNRVRRSRRR